MENDHPSAAGRSLKLLWVAALVLAGAFLLREPYPSEDSAFFEYVGRALSEGRHLYSDLWDNKLPSVFLVNQLWWKLFGAHYRAHLLAEAIVCVLTVLLFALILRHFGVREWPLGVALFTLVYMLNAESLNQTERYATPLILGAVLLILAKRPILSGIVLVLASTFWVPSFATTVIPILWSASRRERVFFALASAIAFAAVLFAMVLTFGTRTCLELLQSWTSYEGAGYSAHRSTGPFGGLPWLFSWAYYVQSGLVLLVALVAVFWKRTQAPGQRFALLWALSSIATVFALGKPFVHYFLSSYAPLVMLLVVQPLDFLMFRQRWYFTGIAVAAIVLMSAVTVRDIRRDQRKTLYAIEYTGSATKADLGTGIVAALPWEAYLSSEAVPPSRFFYGPRDSTVCSGT